MPENSDIRQSGRNILLIQDIQDGFWLLRHRAFYLSGTETKANWRSWYYIETLEKWKGKKKKKSEINNVCLSVIASPNSSSSSASAIPKAASQTTSLPPPQPTQCEDNDGDLYDDLLLPNE